MFCSTLNSTKTIAMLGLALVLSIHPAKLAAGPITWTIANDTTLSAGASVSGSFSYDADLQSGAAAYSNVDIVVGNDNGTNWAWQVLNIPGDTYSTILGSSTTSTNGLMELNLLGSTYGDELDIVFPQSLTDAGGPAAFGINFLAGEQVVDHEFPGYIGFNAEITGAPEPQSALLMLLGVMGIIGAGSGSSLAPVRRISRLKR